MLIRRLPHPRPFVVRRSSIQGKGAFATRFIHAGVRLIEYTGERLTRAEAEARYPESAEARGERHHTYLFAIDEPEEVVIDAAVGGNAARFINHSCDPNCDAVIEDGRIWIETIRDVAPGEELAYDYARGAPLARREAPLPVPLRSEELSGDDTRQEEVESPPDSWFLPANAGPSEGAGLKGREPGIRYDARPSTSQRW